MKKPVKIKATKPEPVKACVNCKFYSKREAKKRPWWKFWECCDDEWFVDVHRCTSPKGKIDFVTGEVRTDRCFYVRMDDELCGEQAKWFEAK